jgi:hypothetical protein
MPPYGFGLAVLSSVRGLARATRSNFGCGWSYGRKLDSPSATAMVCSTLGGRIWATLVRGRISSVQATIEGAWGEGAESEISRTLFSQKLGIAKLGCPNLFAFVGESFNG